MDRDFACHQTNRGIAESLVDRILAIAQHDQETPQVSSGDGDWPEHGSIWLDKLSGACVGVLAVCAHDHDCDNPREPIVSGAWHKGLGLEVEDFAFPLSEFRGRFLLLAVDPDTRPKPSTLTDEAVKEVTKQIVEGADGEVISLPYSTVRDALENVLGVHHPTLTDEEREHLLNLARYFDARGVEWMRP